MAETKIAVDTKVSTAAGDKVEAPTTMTKTEELEARIKAIEADRAKAIDEAANYKVAFLKEKSRNDDLSSETEEERVRRITNEELSKKKIAELDSEKDRLMKDLIKENKELKLANLNKPNTPPATMGDSGTETPRVTDTIITPEQLAAFKARGWTDKDIERYKKNLNRYGGR